jgi:hypothetical protein
MSKAKRLLDIIRRVRSTQETTPFVQDATKTAVKISGDEINARLSALLTYRATRLNFAKATGRTLPKNHFELGMAARTGNSAVAAQVAKFAEEGKAAVREIKKARKDAVQGRAENVRFIRRGGKIIPIRAKKKGS